MVEGLTFFSTDQGSAAGPGSPGATRRNRSSSIGAPRQPLRASAAGRCRSTIHAENPGDTGGEATPVPIPNTEVKLSSAEDTERAAFRENRSSPGFLRFRAGDPGPGSARDVVGSQVRLSLPS